MKALVHAGMHKAGSTYLQALMRNNRDTLAGNGIGVIANRPFKSYAKHLLNRQWRDAETMAEDFAHRIADAGYENWILSAETLELVARRRRSFGRLEAFLNERFHRHSYFVMVRDPVDFMSSHIQHRARGLYEFEVAPNWLRAYRPSVRYLARFGALARDGTETDFVPLDAIREVGGPGVLSVQIRGRFGLEVALPVDVEPRNTGIGPKGVAAASLVLYSIANSIGGTDVPEAVRRPLSKLVIAQARERGWDNDRYFAFSDDDGQAIHAAIRPAEERFAQRVWGCPWADKMVPRRYRKSVFDWGAAAQSEIDEIRDVHDRALAELYRLCDAEGISCRRVRADRVVDHYLGWYGTVSRRSGWFWSRSALSNRPALVA